MPLNVCRAMSSFCQSDALCRTKVYKQVGAAARCGKARHAVLRRQAETRDFHSHCVCRARRIETADLDFARRVPLIT